MHAVCCDALPPQLPCAAARRAVCHAGLHLSYLVERGQEICIACALGLPGLSVGQLRSEAGIESGFKAQRQPSLGPLPPAVHYWCCESQELLRSLSRLPAVSHACVNDASLAGFPWAWHAGKAHARTHSLCMIRPPALMRGFASSRGSREGLARVAYLRLELGSQALQECVRVEAREECRSLLQQVCMRDGPPAAQHFLERRLRIPRLQRGRLRQGRLQHRSAGSGQCSSGAELSAELLSVCRIVSASAHALHRYGGADAPPSPRPLPMRGCVARETAPPEAAPCSSPPGPLPSARA